LSRVMYRPCLSLRSSSTFVLLSLIVIAGSPYLDPR
jgi:hypothetical protein